jgi:hypothetical protein
LGVIAAVLIVLAAYVIQTARLRYRQMQRKDHIKHLSVSAGNQAGAVTQDVELSKMTGSNRTSNSEQL